MAATFTATATATTTSHTMTVRGTEFPAYEVTCDCRTCGGHTVLVPTATVEARGTKLALHNYVAQRTVLGFPTA